MATLEPLAPTAAIDPATQIGVVALTVSDLKRSIDFYTRAIGFTVLQQKGHDATLGVAGTPLLLLREQPGALPWMVDNATGLYHFAILVPTRADLGRWLANYVALHYPPPGQGDHIVSEALYLRDCDGHGIEVYRDRPREGWVWHNGRVQMGGGPVDVRGMMAEGRAEGQPWAGMPAGTKIGHVHLQVGDVAQGETFYHGTVGFDIVAQMPSALFVSAGGYHHHLGMNTWHSKDADPAPADTATMRFYSIAFATDTARDAAVARIVGAGIETRTVEDAVAVRDPWQNTILLHTGAAPGAAAVAALG